MCISSLCLRLQAVDAHLVERQVTVMRFNEFVHCLQHGVILYADWTPENKQNYLNS